MPRIAQRTNVAMDNYRPLPEPSTAQPGVASSNQPLTVATPVLNPFLRCPMPLLVAYPDNLRQYYRDSIPQRRALPVTL
jgi:hypothetical protein